MKKLQEFFAIPEDRVSIARFLLLILIAYLFALSLRFVWVYIFSGQEQFYWNNELMISTNDGYYWAEGARDIIAGFHQAGDLSPVDRQLPKLTAFLYKILPFSFETLILYMPGFIGSLLVIPVLLIGRTFNHSYVGFVAALLAGIAWSYYNRTMISYYDDDLLVVIAPTFIVLSFIYAMAKKELIYLAFPPLAVLLIGDWHGGIGHIITGIFYMILVYTLIFDRKSLFNYKLLAITALLLIAIPFYLKVLVVALLFGLFYYLKDRLTEKVVFIIAAIFIAIYLALGGISYVFGVLKHSYIVRPLLADEINYSLKFYDVVNTVREAGHIDFTTFANRISGHTITLFASIIGYIMFAIRYPFLLLSLPMVVLGFFALKGGLRFTIFAVPFMALGVAYLIFYVAKFVAPLPRVAIISILTAAVLYPNVKHIQEYMTPTVMNKSEVEALDALKKIASREDYVLTWWDYGYPIRFYSDVKTLVDGGRHDGESNFPASFLLTTSSQLAAAQISRIVVEVDEKERQKDTNQTPPVKAMLKYYGYKSAKEFLNALNSPMQLPTKTREVFIYLPFRMFEIFPTVKLFSNLDIDTGRIYQQPFFYMAQGFQKQADSIVLGNGIKLYEQGGLIEIGGQKLQIKNFVQTFYTNDLKLNKNIQQINPSSPISVIYMQSYNTFLVLDDTMFNSLFVQLFVLENYDSSLFEPVIMGPLTKIYKLKI